MSSSSVLDYSKKMLSYLRQGDLDVVAESVRRNVDTHVKKPIVHSLSQLKGPSIPEWKCETSRPKHDISVGVICDDFTRLCFEPEWEALYLYPDAWEDQLADTSIDFLFVESIPRGTKIVYSRQRSVATHRPSANGCYLRLVLRAGHSNAAC